MRYSLRLLLILLALAPPLLAWGYRMIPRQVEELSELADIESVRVISSWEEYEEHERFMEAHRAGMTTAVPNYYKRADGTEGVYYTYTLP